MRKSFLDNPNIVYIFGAYLICMPLAAALLSSCSKATPEEKIQAHERAVSWIKDDLIVLVPRSGVECYVLRSHRSDVPNSLSCIGTVPVTTGQ
jgi:hypothetical protein